LPGSLARKLGLLARTCDDATDRLGYWDVHGLDPLLKVWMYSRSALSPRMPGHCEEPVISRAGPCRAPADGISYLSQVVLCYS
jgi:hypothetical protein